MSNVPLDVLSRFAKLAPCKVSALEDLRPFGALRPELFEEKLSMAPGPYQIKIMQGGEEKFWNKDPWYYIINEYNFRGVWDFTDKRKRIGFFGCSFTMGEGIQDSNQYTNIVAENFDLNVFNFGSGGSGIERVSRTFSAVNSIVSLDYAVVTLPAWHRQLHTGEMGDMINLIPSYPHLGFEKLCKLLTSLDEDYYATRAITNINWILDVAKFKGIKVLFSSWDHTTNATCKILLPDNTLNPFPNIDDKCARDRMHPGIKSQQAHAEQIIKAINDRTWI